MKNLFLVIFFTVFTLFIALAQEKIPSIHIKKTTSAIILDGVLDETDWQTAELASRFLQSSPFDTTYSSIKTEVCVTFDDDNIYVGAKCFQKKGTYVVQSLKRDFGPGTTDLFGMIFDTYGDKQNAFSFAVSPLGVQREGLIANGNEFTTDWDNKWYSEVKNFDDFYIVEVAIPFKTIRYNQTAGVNEWNINFLRFDQSVTPPERSTWAFLPRFASGNNVAFMGRLIWDTPPPKPRANVALIPYILGSSNKDVLGKKKTITEGVAGFDAKVAVSSSMNLDLTVNPDFAQVDVDRQQTNLSRFELFFPERRQFFLENSDLFGSFGFGNINPFFSRRIGLGTGNVKVPIIAGARLTGKLDNNWRVGLMNLQTDVNSSAKIAASNFTTAAVQRKVFSRSNIGLILVNKANFRMDTLGKNLWEVNNKAFNRVAGVDYKMFSKDGSWQGKAFYHRSFSPTNSQLVKPKNPFTTSAYVEYRVRHFNFETSYEMVGRDYNAEVGYVPRTNYYRTEPNINWVFYPQSKKVNQWSIGADGDARWRITDNKNTDWDFSPLVFNMIFKNNAKLGIRPLRYDHVYLFDDFDPTNTGGKKLLTGTAYTYPSTQFTFISDTRKRLNFSLEARMGKYFNGSIGSLASHFSYRYQPYGIFSVDVNYNNINLPTGFNDRTLWLISPRIDLSFTRDVFFTTFLQYNNQINNVNLNARFQWRFAPVSDLFIVYTDNYFATDDDRYGYRAFQTKNRGIVLKCTYWLNL
jgi:hypothetical protein